MRLAAFLLATGCTAGFYLVGATPQQGMPAAPKASWKIAACARPNGATEAAPAATYYLDDQAFYEMGADGSGARITNGWTDDKGRYFFTRVKGSHGWMYFLPNDPAVPAVRFIYEAGSYAVEELNGIIKPSGTPGITCTLVKS